MFKDHADAMRVINATFAGHELSDQPCRSWMVRRPGESAYHFVVTWLPGRALIVSGDIGEATYCGITHLTSLDETVRLIRESSFEYLSGKSTHRREFDARATAKHVIEMAYAEMRYSLDLDSLKRREDRLMCSIVDWHDGNIHNQITEHDAEDRKAACQALLDGAANGEVDQGLLIEIAGDWEIGCMSWPPAAHWHYEALRTWADLMARAKVKAEIEKRLAPADVVS